MSDPTKVVQTNFDNTMRVIYIDGSYEKGFIPIGPGNYLCRGHDNTGCYEPYTCNGKCTPIFGPMSDTNISYCYIWFGILPGGWEKFVSKETKIELLCAAVENNDKDTFAVLVYEGITKSELLRKFCYTHKHVSERYKDFINKNMKV